MSFKEAMAQGTPAAKRFRAILKKKIANKKAVCVRDDCENPQDGVDGKCWNHSLEDVAAINPASWPVVVTSLLKIIEDKEEPPK